MLSIRQTIRNRFLRYVSEKIKNVARSDCEIHEKVKTFVNKRVKQFEETKIIDDSLGHNSMRKTTVKKR